MTSISAIQADAQTMIDSLRREVHPINPIPYRLYLTTNEKSTVDTLHIMENEENSALSDLQSKIVVIIATSGLFGLEVTAKRIHKLKQQNPNITVCFINIDIGPTAIFMNSFPNLLNKIESFNDSTCSRLCAAISKTITSRSREYGYSDNDAMESDLTKLQTEAWTGTSWLKDPASFQNISQMIKNGHYIALCQDFCNLDAIKKISDILERHKAIVDTIYVANIGVVLYPYTHLLSQERYRKFCNAIAILAGRDQPLLISGHATAHLDWPHRELRQVVSRYKIGMPESFLHESWLAVLPSAIVYPAAPPNQHRASAEKTAPRRSTILRPGLDTASSTNIQKEPRYPQGCMARIYRSCCAFLSCKKPLHQKNSKKLS